jgi:hypothetical protein
MRRRVWPPSKPSASSPSGSRSKATPAARSSRTASAPPRPALHGRGPAEAASRRRSCRPACLAGESPGSSAGRQASLRPEAGALRRRRARDQQTAAPCSAARSAVHSPAARRRRRRRRTRRLALSPLASRRSSRPDLAARRRRLRGRAPQRRRWCLRPAAARRRASSTRFSAASACDSISARRLCGGGDRPILGRALSVELLGVLPAQLLQRFRAPWRSRSRSASRPGSRRRPALRPPRPTRRLAQPPLGGLDLCAEILTGVAPSSLIAASIYYLPSGRAGPGEESL